MPVLECGLCYGVSSLKHDGKLVTDTIGKAEVLNNQFQSVFTRDPDGDPPDKGPSPHPQMAPFQIGVAGTIKLIKGLNVHKAAGYQKSVPMHVHQFCSLFSRGRWKPD